MVMLVIFALAVIAGGFAYSVKVETILARNANDDHEFEWLARSGIEYARWAVAEQLTIRTPPYDALDQFWSLGHDGTNEVFFGHDLKSVEMGRGSFRVDIVDMESRYNINMATPDLLENAATLIGIDYADVPVIVDSILDWIDADDYPRPNGVESDYYQGLDPPYLAKNGPIDDLSELLLVNGITEDMYFGSDSAAVATVLSRGGLQSRIRGAETVYTNSFVKLFTTTSIGKVNPHTAPNEVFLLFMDEPTAAHFLRLRVEAPEQLMASLGQVGGGPPGAQGGAAAIFGPRSANFEVRVTVQIGARKRVKVAHVVRIPNQIEPKLLHSYWE